MASSVRLDGHGSGWPFPNGNRSCRSSASKNALCGLTTGTSGATSSSTRRPLFKGAGGAVQGPGVLVAERNGERLAARVDPDAKRVALRADGVGEAVGEVGHGPGFIDPKIEVDRP
jgi:hypothetical protein